MSAGRVIVYGGRGALGTAVVEKLVSENFWTINVDLAKNETSLENVLVSANESWIEQESNVLESRFQEDSHVSHSYSVMIFHMTVDFIDSFFGVQKLVGQSKIDAVLCVAGGWAGGSAKSPKMIQNADLMWKQSVWSSSICARLAVKHLRPGGLIQLTGAAAILGGSPDMIGYGMAKAAVHHLTKSLSQEGSGLPKNSSALAILPTCLDTPMNRKFITSADFSTWTPLEFVADLLYKWIIDPSSRPQNGSLVKLLTSGGQTTTEIV